MNIKKEVTNINRFGGVTNLVVVDRKSYSKTIPAIVEHLTANGDHLIYISLNKEAPLLNQVLLSHNILTENIFYISTMDYSHLKKITGNYIFLNSPSHLSDIAMAFDELIHRLKDEKVVLFMDSLTNLINNNNTQEVIGFINHIKKKTNDLNINTTIISTNDEPSVMFINNYNLFNQIITIKR